MLDILYRDFISFSNDTTIFLKRGHSFAEVVAIRLNVSYSVKITPQEVIGVFKGNLDCNPFKILLSVFFNDLSPILVKCFMDENGITIDNLCSVYEQIPPCYQSPWFTKFKADYENGAMSCFVVRYFS